MLTVAIRDRKPRLQSVHLSLVQAGSPQCASHLSLDQYQTVWISSYYSSRGSNQGYDADMGLTLAYSRCHDWNTGEKRTTHERLERHREWKVSFKNWQEFQRINECLLRAVPLLTQLHLIGPVSLGSITFHSVTLRTKLPTHEPLETQLKSGQFPAVPQPQIPCRRLWPLSSEDSVSNQRCLA